MYCLHVRSYRPRMLGQSERHSSTRMLGLPKQVPQGSHPVHDASTLHVHNTAGIRGIPARASASLSPSLTTQCFFRVRYQA